MRLFCYPKNEIKYNLSNLWDDFLDPVHSIVQFLKNVHFYAPTLWNDRWWDSGFLLELLVRRLRRDAKMYETHGHHSDFQMIAGEMKETADICDRLHQDNYYDANGYKAHLDKWGHGIGINRLMNDEERVEFNGISTKAREAQEKDLARLGELFTHILNWWD